MGQSLLLSQYSKDFSNYPSYHVVDVPLDYLPQLGLRTLETGD